MPMLYMLWRKTAILGDIWLFGGNFDVLLIDVYDITFSFIILYI